MTKRSLSFDFSGDTIIDVIRLFIFGTAISVVSLLLGKFQHNENINIPFRPPSYVFGIVWSILYVLVGIGWYLTNADLELTILTLYCCLWLFVYLYLKYKKISALVLVLTALSSLNVIIQTMRHGGIEEGIIFIPLFIWLCFASYLNIYEAMLT